MEAEWKSGQTVIPTPTWVLAVRICQIILSIITLGLAGWWIHGLYANPVGFAIVCVVFTWVVCAYQLISERLPAARNLYNTWAVLALDGLMIIFWLAAMGALAAYRGRFTVNVSVSGCTSDGSAINSNTCVINKRAGVAGYGILKALSANAGICAINMLLFVATFAYVAHFFRLAYVASKPAVDPEKPAAVAGMAAAAAPAAGGPGVDPTQSNPLLGQHQLQQYPGQPQPQMYQQQQQQQQPAGYPQQAPQYVQNQPYDPYVQQNTAYAGAGGAYDQTQQQHQQQPPQQPMYSPQGTPAPGQPYQLPAQ